MKVMRSYGMDICEKCMDKLDQMNIKIKPKIVYQFLTVAHNKMEMAVILGSTLESVCRTSWKNLRVNNG